MKTRWDYTSLADAYLKRPDYSSEAIERLLRLSRVGRGDAVCDIGAGAAHLTLPLAERGLKVTAVEPNQAMRAHGMKRTAHLPGVVWHEGTGEETGLEAFSFKLVAFGSSFNVTDAPAALREAARILAPGGWFACLWNHRDLDDPIQADIEALIRSLVPGYDYGARRADQTPVIDASGLFGAVKRFEGKVTHTQSRSDCLEAWRSHATLKRQAKGRFPLVIAEIGALLDRMGSTSAIRPRRRRGLDRRGSGRISIPYTTRVWAAKVKKRP